MSKMPTDSWRLATFCRKRECEGFPSRLVGPCYILGVAWCGPLPVVTARCITCLVGHSCKPSFATVAGPHPNDIHHLLTVFPHGSHFCQQIPCENCQFHVSFCWVPLVYPKSFFKDVVEALQPFGLLRSIGTDYSTSKM